MIWTIYCHTLTKDGRRYIGQTKSTMMARWSGHVAQAYKGWMNSNPFSTAIRKYGTKAWTHEELACCRSQRDADTVEAEMIARYETCDEAFGFNTQTGGVRTVHPGRAHGALDPKPRKTKPVKPVPALVDVQPESGPQVTCDASPEVDWSDFVQTALGEAPQERPVNTKEQVTPVEGEVVVLRQRIEKLERDCAHLRALLAGELRLQSIPRRRKVKEPPASSTSTPSRTGTSPSVADRAGPHRRAP